MRTTIAVFKERENTSLFHWQTSRKINHIVHHAGRVVFIETDDNKIIDHFKKLAVIAKGFQKFEGRSN